MAKKRPKGGGRKRRAWKKANIEDVEEAVEDARLIQSLKQKQMTDGKRKRGVAADNELFTIDTRASGEGLSRSSRREAARAKLFPTKDKNIGFSAAEEAKIARAEGCLSARKCARAPSADEPEAFDLWAGPSAKLERGHRAAVLPPQGSSCSVPRRRKEPVNMPKTVHQKVGIAPAVIPAHEGQSVNPASQAYEDLAYLAAARQLAKEHDEDDLDRQLAPMTAAVRDVVGDEIKSMDAEAKVKLFRNIACPRGAAVVDDTADASGGNIASAAKWRQKSQALRNKERKRKDVDAMESQAVKQKRLDKSVGDVGAILKEMNEQEQLLASRRAHKEAAMAQRRAMEASSGAIPKRRRLGGNRTQFVEDDLAVPMTAAGARSLRSMPLNGSALQERVSSIMRRGLLPAPPAASKTEVERTKRKNNKVRGRKKFISPLLKDHGVHKGQGLLRMRKRIKADNENSIGAKR